jgi:hypothetical protein
MRSGSTWLHRNLRAHPGLWLPPIKELHYFDCQADGPRLNKFSRAHLRRRLRFYGHPRALGAGQIGWDLHYFFGRRSDRWYTSLFRSASGRLAGEIPPRYSILEPDAIARAAALRPDLRLIFVMRNPLERSWSQVTKGALDQLGDDARRIGVDGWIERLRSEGVRSRSDYPAILRRWTQRFDPGRLFLAFFEEIGSSPRDLLCRLFDFLGVETPGEAWFQTERVRGRANPTPDSGIAMPAEVRRFLAGEYREILGELHERFGGHASRWHQEALAERTTSAAAS